MPAAKAEITRTFQKILSKEGNQQPALINAMKSFIETSFANIAQVPADQLRSIFNLLPEMASPKISIGSICADEENRKFVVLGYFKNSFVRAELHPSGDGTDRISVKGLCIDSERTEFLQKKLINLKPKFSEDEEQSARNSLALNNATLVGQLLTALEQSSSAGQEPNYLLQAFVVRGISNMIRLLKGEYLNFLKEENLLTEVIEAAKLIS